MRVKIIVLNALLLLTTLISCGDNKTISQSTKDSDYSVIKNSNALYLDSYKKRKNKTLVTKNNGFLSEILKFDSFGNYLSYNRINLKGDYEFTVYFDSEMKVKRDSGLITKVIPASCYSKENTDICFLIPATPPFCKSTVKLFEQIDASDEYELKTELKNDLNKAYMVSDSMYTTGNYLLVSSLQWNDYERIDSMLFNIENCVE
jgi:hypothetical protein